jgi:hypothetical protein
MAVLVNGFYLHTQADTTQTKIGETLEEVDRQIAGLRSDQR